MTTASKRLTTIRRAYRFRGDAKTGADISYTVYAAALIALIVGFPVSRALVVLLTEPPVLAAMQTPVAPRLVSVLFGLLLVGFAALGRARGPVALSPFFVTLLAGTDLPSSRTLLRPFATTVSIVVAASSALGILVGSVLVLAGSASFVGGVVFVAGCGSFSLIACFVWLWAQRSVHSWVPSVALLAAVIITTISEPLLAAAPWGWAGGLWPADGPPTLSPVILLCVTAGACWVFLPRFLNSLNRATLLQQSQRWQSAATAAVSGDLATALGGFRAKPSIGRAWTAVTKHTMFARFLLRDLTGTLRTPGRFFTGMVFLLLANSISALAFAPTALPAWLPATIGSAIGYLALGVLSDGFRHAAEAAGTSPLYGYSTTRLYLLHAILPLALSFVSGTVGTVIAVLLGAPIISAMAIGIVAVLLVFVRAYDSAKGPLPIILLTPMPSPAGDPSVLAVLGWQADAVLIASVTGTIILSLAASGSLHAIAIAIVVTTALLILLRRRLHKL
jgi:hypothetical protein